MSRPFEVEVTEVEILEPAMPTGHKVKVGKVSSKALAKGKIAPADSTPAPVRKAKAMKAAREEAAWKERSIDTRGTVAAGKGKSARSRRGAK